MESDKSNLRETILNFPQQLKAPLDFFNQLNFSRRPFNKIILCGMGGSALAGDLFNYFKMQGSAPFCLNQPLLLHRSYGLPAGCDQNTLIICASHSGNTEETISSFDTALQNNLAVAGLVSDGRLAEIFQERKIPWVKIPDGKIPPRYSLGYQLTALVQIFVAYGLLPQNTQTALSLAAKTIKPNSLEKEANIFCQKLINKIPVIYSSRENLALARIWKIKFNENTKIPAFFNFFPELNHNEMNGWEKTLGPFIFLLLRDKNDQPRLKKRMELTGQILKELGWPVEFIEIKDGDALEKLLWVLAYGDWLSYYLALFYGVDPTPVGLVEELKKRLPQ